MAAGLDGAIPDLMDKKMMSFVYAAEALLGRDEYCVNYVAEYRGGGTRDVTKGAGMRDVPGAIPRAPLVWLEAMDGGYFEAYPKV
jgi:hypothetical protein